jgi:xylulokinase
VQIERLAGVDAYDLLNRQAARVPPGCEGLIFLPYLMGERTPIWDVNARGVLFGLSLNHTKGHLIRAAMEGVAFALYHSFETLGAAGLRVNYPLVLNEGGARSSLWRRIITDVFDVPTVLLERRTGAPFGDAILAGVATGIFPDFGVARQWAVTVEPMEPDPAAHACYMEHFALFKQVYQDLKADFVALARLRSAVPGEG